MAGAPLTEFANTNQSFRRLASALSGQWLYLLGGEGVVYSESMNRFAGLGVSGTSAYRAFEAGATISDLRQDSDSRHLFSAAGDGLQAIHALSQGVFPPERSDPEWPALDDTRSGNVEVNGVPILLEYPSGPLSDLCRDCFQKCAATEEPARSHFSVKNTEGGWTIYVNGSEFMASLRNEQLGLGYLHAVRSLLYAEAEYDIAFHAAMVVRNDRGLMLCAPRESGKSTLAAYLISRGFELVSDEPALLDLDTCSVSSLCLPMSMKEGSWIALRQHWPHLGSGPVHVRSDGIRICLFHPPAEAVSTRPAPLTNIIFPEYNPSVGSHMEPLSPLATLNHLNDGGMILAKHFDRDAFEALLRLVCLVPAFKIRYSSLEEADRMIECL